MVLTGIKNIYIYNPPVSTEHVPFKVVYNHKPFDENGNHIYTIFAENCKAIKKIDGKLNTFTKTIYLTVTEEELDELKLEIEKAVLDRILG